MLAVRHELADETVGNYNKRQDAGAAASIGSNLLEADGAGGSDRRHGQFDLRAAVGAYAPIIALFGSLAVPAIVLLLTVPALNSNCKPSPSPATAATGFATGLLVLGMLGGLLGALAAAAIGAERELTVNLIPAVMYMAVPAIASVVSILGAFEVLVALYLPASATLFAIIAATGGLFGVIFTAFAVADSPRLGSTAPASYQEWIEGELLQDARQARRWALSVFAVASAPIFISLFLWYWQIIKLPPNSGRYDILIGSGLGLIITFTARSEIRATHTTHGKDRGLRPYEAFLPCLAIGLYTAAVVILMPHNILNKGSAHTASQCTAPAVDQRSIQDTYYRRVNNSGL